MKNLRGIVFLCIILVCIITSCQKKYVLPDLTTGTATTTTTVSSLLIKSESKTTGSSQTSATTYGYNASSRLISLTTVNVDTANKTTTTFYHYTRDGLGRVTNITTNVLSADSSHSGFPDSITVNVHYPAFNSLNFDYATYSLLVAGMTYKDSVAYTYLNGVISEESEYQAVVPASMALVVKLQFVYNNNNVVSEKVFDPSYSTSTQALTYAYEYDGKVSPLFTGNEGFLAGQNNGFASKNNLTKSTINDNTNGTVLASFIYTLQYNSNNLPITGTVLGVPGNASATLKFTYQ